VHKDTVAACAQLAGAGGEVRREVHAFGTTTRGLLELSDWMTVQRMHARNCAPSFVRA
jgi:hypothetical protein